MTPHGTPINDMGNTITLDEYKHLFTKNRENTASSPSKLHMGHYISSCEHDKISQVRLAKINISLHYEFKLDRWNHSLHGMILQKERHYIDKLRIIQLIESDFNTAMKILLSRRIMQYAGKSGINSTQKHGGR